MCFVLMKLPFVESDSLYREEPFKTGVTVFQILLNHRLAIIINSLQIKVSLKNKKEAYDILWTFYGNGLNCL
jgi:hypothetical protein